MNDHYVYQGAPEERVFGALPPGDYNFKVAGIDAPYWKNQKWILSVRLTIERSGIQVFANPWSGKTSDGEARDGIGEFLLAINRTPSVGEEPDWSRMLGARGKCTLKVEIASQGALAGKEVNRVAFFHRPKQLAAELPKVGPKPPTEPDDLNMEPTDIPF